MRLSDLLGACPEVRAMRIETPYDPREEVERLRARRDQLRYVLQEFQTSPETVCKLERRIRRIEQRLQIALATLE